MCNLLGPGHYPKSVSKKTGAAPVGIQLIVFCLVVAVGWLAFIHYILRTSKEDNNKIK